MQPAWLEKKSKIVLKSDAMITVTILLPVHGNPTATVFTKFYIYLYEVKRLSNMPNNLVIIHYLHCLCFCGILSSPSEVSEEEVPAQHRHYDTIYKPNVAVVFLHFKSTVSKSTQYRTI